MFSRGIFGGSGLWCPAVSSPLRFSFPAAEHGVWALVDNVQVLSELYLLSRLTLVCIVVERRLPIDSHDPDIQTRTPSQAIVPLILEIFADPCYIMLTGFRRLPVPFSGVLRHRIHDGGYSIFY